MNESGPTPPGFKNAHIKADDWKCFAEIDIFLKVSRSLPMFLPQSSPFYPAPPQLQHKIAVNTSNLAGKITLNENF